MIGCDLMRCCFVRLVLLLSFVPSLSSLGLYGEIHSAKTHYRGTEITGDRDFFKLMDDTVDRRVTCLSTSV